VPALSDSYRIIALDLPGFGFSTREAEDMSIAGQVAYLRAFLDTLGIEKAILVGHSMGGAIAMAFVTEHAERVKALVLVSPATAGQLGRMRYLAPVLRPFVPLFAWAVLYNPPLRRRWLSLAVHDPRFLTPELIRRYGLPAHVRGNVGALQRWLMDRRRDRELRPEAIAAPTLIVWGASDRLLRPSGGERLQGQIRGSRLVVVPEAGHLVLEERPDAVNPLILDFLHEVTGRKEEHPVADQAPAPPPQA
jgi:pimeloyl-ACP methyl ester carboxylesterase